MRSTLLTCRYVIGLGLLLALGCRAQAADNHIDINQAIAHGTPITIQNTAGHVSVHGSQRDNVHIGGTRGDEAQQIRLIQDDKAGLVIKVIYPDRAAADRGTDLVVNMPASSALAVGTVSADVTTDGQLGPIQVQTVSGDISLDADTSGMIVHSVSGDIDVDLGSGRVDRLALSSVSGDISYDGGLAPAGHYDFDDVSGDIALAVPAKAGAQYRLATLSGDINNDFGPSPRRGDGSPKLSLNFSQALDGAGGADQAKPAQIGARAVSGDIAIMAD